MFAGFFEERAILLGLLGKHEQALGIFVYILDDLDEAEEWVIYSYLFLFFRGTLHIFTGLNQETDSVFWDVYIKYFLEYQMIFQTKGIKSQRFFEYPIKLVHVT